MTAAYVVTTVDALPSIDDEGVDWKPPPVRRDAVAETADAAVLAVGNRQASRFESTWQPEHFAGVPTYDGERSG